MGTALCDDSCIWSAIDSAQIAATTKSNHKRRLRFLMQHVYNRRTKTPLLHLVSHPAYAVKAIETHTDEPQTRKSYASSILACFKHMPQLKEEYPKEFERWLGFERAEGAKIAEQYRSNQPTALQAAKAVGWGSVRSLVHQMPKGSYERLMVAWYTMVTPGREDFSPCKVVRSETDCSECERNGINCVKLDEEPEICIAHHKTRNSHGTIRKAMPAELCQEIEHSLLAYPRSWLFSATDGSPWCKEYFRQRFSDAMLKWIGHRLGPSTLRHAFISSTDFNKTSLKQAEQYAHSMGHHVSTLRKYHHMAGAVE
jgi:integrase